MKEYSISYEKAKQETEKLIAEAEKNTITHRSFTAECLRRILKENEELKLYNNSITSQLEQMTTEKFKEGWIHQSEFKDFIPVQKIKGKIEELDEMINQISKGNLQRYTVGEIICFKKILKEILEEEYKK